MKPGRVSWHQPALEALAISAFVLGLTYYWFGVANRHVIFLYDHVTVGIPRAQPFDRMTSSRYWMAGLVAGGLVTVLVVAVGWLRGRLARRRQAQIASWPWWRVWLLTTVPVSIGVPAITMTVNAPTLPLGLAAACAASTLLGLAAGLAAGEWAVTRPLDLLWLIADGVGLVPVLTLLKAVELPGRGPSIGDDTARLVAVGSVLFGLAWLAGMSWLRAWRQREAPATFSPLVSGLGLSYILMPLVHHLLATPPGYRYITNAGNFFAFTLPIQALALATAAALSAGASVARRRLVQHPTS